MPDKESNDVLMTFIDNNGRGVAAECTSVWDKDDTDMMKDFQDGKFFEVDDFDFGVSLGGSEDGGGGEGGGSSAAANLGENSLHAPPGRDGAPTEKKKPSSSGSSKRFAKYLEGGDMDFKPEVKEITITKQVDISSIRFLQSCLTYGKFQKAVLVKRKFTGGFAFHEAFLRLEFKEPLITGIDWDEGDIVKEKIKFICRGIIVAYRPQNQDGTLGDARSATWTPTRKLAATSS
jgi:type VI protein secretion system component Hcp